MESKSKYWKSIIGLGLFIVCCIGLSSHSDIVVKLLPWSESSHQTNVVPDAPNVQTFAHFRGKRQLSEPVASANDAVVKTFDLEKGKQKLNELLDLIYNRYQLGDPEGDHFYSNQNIATNGWDIYKYRLAKKVLTPTNEDRRYLMIFGGSSVTAGHDNRFNSSYPLIVKKRLDPIFEALGLDLVVDNIAQGNNNCMPYELCYESMGNEDPDFVNWEQSYNCGHDKDAFEYTARVAGMSKHRGVVYFSASGAWVPQGELSQFNPPYCAEEWTVSSVQAPHTPLTHKTFTAADLAAEREKLNKFHGSGTGGSYQRFLSDSAYIASTAPSGFNVWQTNPVTKKPGVDSVLPTTRFFTAEAGWYDNPGKNGARHHPTKAFHMMRGESIAYLHAVTLLDALYMIIEDLAGGATRESLFEKYTKQLDKIQPPLPKPKACQKAGLYCEDKAVCYTDYTPHYNANRTLRELVIGKTEWAESGAELTDWHNKGGYQDLKPVWSNEKIGGEIYLKVATGKTNRMMLCGGKESLKHITIQIDLHAGEKRDTDYSQYSFDSRPAGSSPLVTWRDRKYAQNECTILSNIPQGTHILGLVRNETLKKDHVSSIAHVVVW